MTKNLHQNMLQPDECFQFSLHNKHDCHSISGDKTKKQPNPKTKNSAKLHRSRAKTASTRNDFHIQSTTITTVSASMRTTAKTKTKKRPEIRRNKATTVCLHVDEMVDSTIKPTDKRTDRQADSSIWIFKRSNGYSRRRRCYRHIRRRRRFPL